MTAAPSQPTPETQIHRTERQSPSHHPQRRQELFGRARVRVAQAPAATGVTAVSLLIGGLTALLFKHRRLALGLATAGLVPLIPAARLPRARRMRPRHVPRGPETVALRVVTFNLLSCNQDVDAICAELARLHADVVIVQELTDPQMQALDRVLGPPQAVEGDGQMHTAIYSRFDATVSRRRNRRQALRATLDVDGTDVVVWALHAQSPWASRHLPTWRRDLDSLAFDLATDPARTMIVAGDCNATLFHRRLRAVVTAGRLRTTRPMLSRGTWRHPRLGWVATLDHVLVRGAITVRAAGVGNPAGSDHRPVWVDLAVAKQPQYRRRPIRPASGQACDR